MQYYLNLAAFTKDQLVYVDESATNERTLLRKYGFAPRGLPVINVQLLRRSTRWSILPALTITGYLNGTLIVQGLVTSNIFIRWLREVVLPQCTPFLGPRSVIVMDNCRIYYVAVSIDLVSIELYLIIFRVSLKLIISLTSFFYTSPPTYPIIIQLSHLSTY